MHGQLKLHGTMDMCVFENQTYFINDFYSIAHTDMKANLSQYPATLSFQLVSTLLHKSRIP